MWFAVPAGVSGGLVAVLPWSDFDRASTVGWASLVALLFGLSLLICMRYVPLVRR